MQTTVSISLAEAAVGAKRKVRTGGGKTVEVQIPAGVESGGKLRVAKQGGPAHDNRMAPGDLYLEIVVGPHPFLKRNENDVELDLPLNLAEAVLGAKVEVPTVGGERLEVKVRPGTSGGAKLRLRGKGVNGGDQYLVFKVVVPAGEVDEASRKLIEEFAANNPQRPRDSVAWA